MRLLHLIFILFFANNAFSQHPIFGKTLPSPPSIRFVENLGQIHDQNHNPRKDIVYAGQTGNVTYYIRKDGISYQFSKIRSWRETDDLFFKQKHKIPDTTVIYRLDATWVGSNSVISWAGEEMTPGYENYYNTNSPEGLLNIRTYNAVSLVGIYNDIDIRYYHMGGLMKYDYIVKPFANYRKIKVLISGATSIKSQANGSVKISTPFGDIEEVAPKVFQNNKELPSSWSVSGDTLSFQITNYDPSQTLLIDPIVREWSTYYGGGGDDTPGTLKTDQSGNLYLCGYTTSPFSIATSSAHQTVFAGGINSTGDAYLVKFNSAGVRQWATYYGGDGTDNATSCAIDGNGNIYLTGNTNTGGWWSPASASLIAGPSSFISTYTTGTNGFLVKFNSSGVRQWGTYSYGNPVTCIADQNGDVYIAGDFPSNFSGGANAIIATPGCHQSTSGGNQDGFIIKFSGSGSRIWGTYYGGTGGDAITSIAVDSNNNLYVAGHASTAQGTIVSSAGSHQFSYGGYQDAFLAKFNSSGVRLWSTYYGGPDYEYGWGCCTDPLGNVYLAGTQVNYYSPYSGTIIATTGSHQSTIGNGFSDAFLVKFNPSGIRLWATYYGGNGLEDGLSCNSDLYGNVYLSGITSSTNAIASASAFQGNFAGGNYDAYLAKFDNNGTRQWGTYYGDIGIDYGSICLTDINNNVYLCGRVTSTANIATNGSHQPTFGGATFDTYLVKFKECYVPTAPVNVTSSSIATLCTGNSATISTQSNGNITWYSSSTGTTSIGFGATYITPTLSAGIYTYYAGASLCADSINPNRTAITITINTNPLPIITANTGTVCSGQMFTVQPAGAASYTINGGSFVVMPMYTTTYLISGTSSLGCVSSSYLTVSVTPSPTITVNSGNMCTGTIYTINPTGAYTYSVTGGSFTVNPNTNTTYSVTGTGSTGCAAINTAVVNVNIIPSPTLVATPSGTICLGDVYSMNAYSTGTLLIGWFTITGGNYIVSPSTTSSYTITCVAGNGCVDTEVITVSVMPLPTLSLTNGYTCLGNSYTITPSGATSYSITGNNFVVTPTQLSNYTVTGTNQYGCKSPPAVCTVSVFVRPTISTTSGSICAGQSFTIAPVGGNSYTISGGTNIVSPINTSTYSVIGTNNSAIPGCQVSNPVISTVFVNPLPTITVNNGTICTGDNFSIVPSGASNYTYSSGSSIVTPISNSTYSVIGSNSLGCVSPTPALSQIVVLSKPALQVVSSASSICAGETVTLTASGAVTYSMHGYSFNPVIVITPSITTQFTVIGTGTNGCVASQSITQFVDICTSITENTRNVNSLKIYPNPSVGELFIDTDEKVTVVILNSIGQMLKTVELSSENRRFSIYEFAAGIYIIRTEGNSVNRMVKVIKE